MTNKTALIAGASGLTGSYCLQYLLQQPSFTKVLSLGRRKLPESHPRLEQIVTDLSSPDALRVTEKIDHVFCLLGTTMKKAGSREAFKKVDHDLPVALAENGQKWGAEYFTLMSALGADPQSRIFYNRVKGETEEELKKFSYKGLHIPAIPFAR